MLSSFATIMRGVFMLAVICANIGDRFASPVSGSGGAGLELLVFHNNDMHARFEQTSKLSGTCSPHDRVAGNCYGGFPRVAQVVKNARMEAKAGTGPQVLYLNAGDTYAGTAWFTLYKWKIVVECLNALLPDAVSLGNHEFDHGISGLIPFIENLESPVLAANLELIKVPELANEPNLQKSAVFNISGVKVGVIGYLTPDTKSLAPRNDVEYIDEVVALKEEVAILNKNGVEILIALGHSGWITDLRIAREVEGIDLVIGGHSNTFLWNGTEPDTEKAQGPYPTMVRQASGRMVPVVQAYAYTKYLGRLHIVFDGRGEIVSYDGSPILLDRNYIQDVKMLQIIEKYRENFTTITEQVIGTSSVLLEGDLPCRSRECNLGNLMADAMVHQYSVWKQEITKNAIAITVAGTIRVSLSKSSYVENITLGNIMEMLPFGNGIVAVRMNGAVLLQALEHSATLFGGDNSGGFLQVSGMKVTYDFAKPRGRRVARALARCLTCGGDLVRVDDDKEYNVVMTDFVAQGGCGYSMFRGQAYVRMPWDDVACMVDYIRAHSPVHAEVEGRITVFHASYLLRKHWYSSAANFHSHMCPLYFISIAVLLLSR